MSLLNSLAAVATRKQIAGTEKMVLLIKLTLFGFRALGAASAKHARAIFSVSRYRIWSPHNLLELIRARTYYSDIPILMRSRFAQAATGSQRI